MSKRPTRFGDRPSSQGEGRGAPMPMVTQPMVSVGPGGLLPMSDSDHGAPTRVQAAVDPSVALQPASRADGLQRPATIDRMPPEIGLTQHHLPNDAPGAGAALATGSSPPAAFASCPRMVGRSTFSRLV